MSFKFKRLSLLVKILIVLVTAAILVPVSFIIFLALFLKANITTDLVIPYPHTQPLPAEFTTLNCEQVSNVYMRAWAEHSQGTDGPDNKVQLAIREEEKQTSGKDGKGKAKVKLTFKEGKVSFNLDNLGTLGNEPFDVTLNNQYRLSGTLTNTGEKPHYDFAATFMLDRKTSLLILSYTDTHIFVGESFGSSSSLYTCVKEN